MKPPKCRLCGHEHALGAKHSFTEKYLESTLEEIDVKRLSVQAPQAKPRSERPVANVANKDAERVRKWRAKNRERYNARERERMRTARRVSP